MLTAIVNITNYIVSQLCIILIVNLVFCLFPFNWDLLLLWILVHQPIVYLVLPLIQQLVSIMIPQQMLQKTATLLVGNWLRTDSATVFSISIEKVTRNPFSSCSSLQFPQVMAVVSVVNISSEIGVAFAMFCTVFLPLTSLNARTHPSFFFKILVSNAIT